MNEICQACNYRKCIKKDEHWNLNATMYCEDGSPDCNTVDSWRGRQNPQLLALLPSPTSYTNPDSGQHLCDRHDGPGTWLRGMLYTLQVPFIVDSLIRCIASDKPQAKELEQCSHYWKDVVKRTQPKVILALGQKAGQAATGRKLTHAQLRNGVWDYIHDPSIKVVVTFEPKQHSSFTAYSKGGRDLRPEFKRVLRQCYAILTGIYKPMDVTYDVCDNPDKMDEFIEEIRQGDEGEVVNDCETANPHPVLWFPQNRLLTSGFGIRRNNLYEQFIFYVREWSREAIGRLYRKLCPGLTVIGTNLKYDLNCAFRFGGVDLEHVVGRIHDTMYLNYIPDQSKWGNSLEGQGITHLGISPYKSQTNAEFDKIRQLIKPPTKNPKKTFAEREDAHVRALIDYWGSFAMQQGYIPQPGEDLHYGHLSRDFVELYQAKDLLVQSRVWWEYFREEFHNLPANLANVYKLMINTTWALMEIERNGLPVNPETMGEVEREGKRQIKKLQAWINAHPYVEAAGLDEFNIKSNPQIGKVVIASKTRTRYISRATGLPCMDKEELKRQIGPKAPTDKGALKEWLRNKPPKQKFWWYVSQLRVKRDRISKFITPYVRYACPDDLRLRTTYSLTRQEGSQLIGEVREVDGGIETGRIASSNPSLHLIVKDPVIRNNFPARARRYRRKLLKQWLLEYDFSGAEPVVLGLLTRCRGYLKVFKRKFRNPNAWDSDLYQLIATKFWADEVEELADPVTFWKRNHKGDLINPVAKELRQTAKVLVLSVTYLQTPESTSKVYNVPVDMAERFTRWFFDEFPEILAKVHEILHRIFLNKIVVTPSGRQSTFTLSQVYAYEPEEHGHLLFDELIEELGISVHDGHMLRKGWNFMIQSTASDCNCAQLVRLHRIIKRKNLWWLKIINAVHDSQWFEVVYAYLAKAHKLILRVMEDPSTYEEYGFDLDFPEDEKYLIVEGKGGPALGSMEGLELVCGQ